MQKFGKGFTLVELLVVMMIIGVLAGLSLFAFQGARRQARDVDRKADLETIRSALELYKADCNRYPATLPGPGSQLTGASCSPSLPSNVYIQSMPGDPTSSGAYRYCPTASNTRYTLSTGMEDSTSTATACGACNPAPCRYQVTNP